VVEENDALDGAVLNFPDVTRISGQAAAAAAANRLAVLDVADIEDEATQQQVTALLRARARIKAEEEVLKANKEESGVELLALAKALGCRGFNLEECGKVFVKESERVTYAYARIIEAMLKNGLSMQKAQKILKEAEKVTKSEFVDFRLA